MDWANDALQSTLNQLDYLRIEPSRLNIQYDTEIGIGGFGEVYLATLDGAYKVAVKQLRIGPGPGIRVRVANRLARELRTWAKAQHPNVLTLIGYHLSKNYDCAQIVSPFMPNGTVTAYIQRTQASTESRLGFVRGLTLGAAYLHNSDPPICHGDIKPANVLINGSLDAVLCDFGLSTFVEDSEMPSGLTTSKSIKGSTRYMSPELFQYEETKQTLKSDVWAWACTVFEIITDLVPYSTMSKTSDILHAIFGGVPPGSLDLLKSPALHVDMPVQSTLDTLRPLISQCWSLDPNKRPSFSIMLDRIEHGLGNPDPDLSREESPEHLSLTRENTSNYLADFSSLDAEMTSILKPSTAAPPVGQVPEKIAQPETIQTTSLAPSAHHQNDLRSLDTAPGSSPGSPPAGNALEEIAQPEAPPTTPPAPYAHHQNDPRPLDTAVKSPIATDFSTAGYVLEDIAEPEAPPTTTSAPSAAQHQDDPISIDTVLELPTGLPTAGNALEENAQPEASPTTPSPPSVQHQTHPRPLDSVVESPIGTELPPAGYVLEDIAEPEATPTTPFAPSAQHQDDPHSLDTIVEPLIGTEPPLAGYVLEDIEEPETPRTTPSAPPAHRRYLADHPGQATPTTEGSELGIPLNLQQSSAGFRRPAHLSVLDNTCLVPMPAPKPANVPQKRGCLCGLIDTIADFFRC